MLDEVDPTTPVDRFPAHLVPAEKEEAAATEQTMESSWLGVVLLGVRPERGYHQNRLSTDRPCWDDCSHHPPPDPLFQPSAAHD